ncbi:hypothetical protein MRX96_009465 [Rhipicephalus microplus]
MAVRPGSLAAKGLGGGATNRASTHWSSLFREQRRSERYAGMHDADICTTRDGGRRLARFLRAMARTKRVYAMAVSTRSAVRRPTWGVLPAYLCRGLYASRGALLEPSV